MGIAEMRDAAERIAASDKVVAFTGAGISAESGIPTFRDPGGIWDLFDPAEVGTFAGMLRLMVEKPWAAIDFLRGMRDAFDGARPNAGHVALAELERMGRVRSVITQNVDGLHHEAGSSRVLQMHGTFARTRCVGCGTIVAATREGFVRDLDEMITKLGSYMVSHPAHVLRRCACGALMRWDFVAFGEPVQELDDAIGEAQTCEVMLICGTSGVVYPAAALPEEAKAAGAFVIEVNVERTELSGVADVALRGPAGRVLPAVVDEIRRIHADVSQRRVAG